MVSEDVVIHIWMEHIMVLCVQKHIIKITVHFMQISMNTYEV
jgi:hypothetical protein